MGSNTQRKNASGNRSDIAWKHGTEVDSNPMKIMCKFCNKIISGNVYRFKHHLACTKQDVEACKSVPVEVKTQMAGVLTQLKKSSKGRMRNEEEQGMIESVPHKRGKMIKESISNGAIGTTQNIINQNSEKRLRDEVCQQIVRFFHTSDIPLSCAKNPEFAKIFELVGKCGSEFVPPSYHELENSSLEKEMKDTTDMLEEYRYEWKKTGCSIICDEWTDTKGMIYCNFLVNSPTGTIFLKSIDTSDFVETVEKVFQALDEIVEKVGEENVFQVITNNAANYKIAMEMLRQKRKRIVWSPCVIQLLDGILEDFEKNVSYHRRTIAKGKKINTFFYSSTMGIMKLRTFTNGKDLNGLTTTPSATAYLNLLYLIDMKVELIRMVSSVDWEKYEFAKTKEGEEIQQIIKDCEFWDDIVDCLNIALPIIEILLKTDSDEKPTIAFIHEQMDGAKKSLQSLNNAKGYQSIWKIINERWFALYNPLHAASYFLNPQFHDEHTRQFASEFEEEPFACLTKWLLDYNGDLSMTIENQTKIEDQLEEFFDAANLFGSQAAMIARHTKDPAKWWDSYGKHCPELQRIAIRLLSLTCSSCGTGQIRNAYEQVYPKKRSCLYQKKLKDLFLVIQNFKSKTQQARRKIFEGINPEASSSDNESITEKEVVELSGAKKGMLVRVEVDEDASEEVPLPGNYSGNEVDTRLYNPQPQSASSEVTLPGNHRGNEVDTCLYNPQPQSASSDGPALANFRIIHDKLMMSLMMWWISDNGDVEE